MNTKKRSGSNLVSIIIRDLFGQQKVSLLLLLCVVCSASCVLIVTQAIRKQSFQQEQLLLEQDVFEGEWRNLIIEENVLADPKRIENRAKNQLGMQYVTDKNETVLVIKNR